MLQNKLFELFLGLKKHVFKIELLGTREGTTYGFKETAKLSIF